MAKLQVSAQFQAMCDRSSLLKLPLILSGLGRLAGISAIRLGWIHVASLTYVLYFKKIYLHGLFKDWGIALNGFQFGLLVMEEGCLEPHV